MENSSEPYIPPRPIDFNSLPPAIRGLMIANVVGFIVGLMVPEMHSLFGLVPQQVIFHRWIWQPLTYLSFHGNFWHLVFNLFALWMFGMPVESQWATRFLKYYFLCGSARPPRTSPDGPTSASPSSAPPARCTACSSPSRCCTPTPSSTSTS